MDFDELIKDILMLIIGGIGTYLLKPTLEAWREKRKQRLEAKAAERREQEEATKQRQLADQYALDYRDKLIEELRNLRILDMVQPLDLERTYVRLKIQTEKPLHYPDAKEIESLTNVDPNLQFELIQDRQATETENAFPPEEALMRNRHMVILGDPGAGKTTMLKYLCLLSARGEISSIPDFPLFVTLNRYATVSPQDKLLDFVAEDVATRYGFPEIRSYLEKRLEGGTVLLLLDGLDEVTVGDPEQAQVIYQHIATEINQLATRYPKCPFVVTSRRAGWKGFLAPSFTVMATLDFNWENIQRFVNNWFGEGSNKARELLKVLSHQTHMRALAANPLLLSLIAIVFEQDLELPERRARLYERCTQVLLTEWDAHRGIRRSNRFTTDRKHDLLEDVALHFHCQRSPYFPKTELLEVIAAYLPTINIPAEQSYLVLDEISAQHGLLKEQAADWYGFLHLTLQEYFAAVSINKENRLDLALEHLHEPWWEEVILLLSGMLKDATPLLEGILSKREDIFFSNLLIAGRCLAGTPRISHSGLREQILSELKTLITDETQHWFPRAEAVRILGESGKEEGTAYLSAILCNQRIHWQVRATAADTLGAIGERSAISHLLSLLTEKQLDQQVGQRIADTLITLNDESTVPQLLKLLLNSEINAEIRARIARTLGYIGNKNAIPGLITALSESNLVWYAGHALVDLQAFKQPEDLLPYLRVENCVVGWSVTKAIENFPPSTASQVFDWLKDTSIDASVRWNVARRLGHLGGKAIHDQLWDVFYDTTLDISVRACTAISLLELNNANAATELKKLLGNSNVDSYVRKKIAQALVAQGERDITNQLLVLLKDASLALATRLRMADLLAEIGDSTIAHELLSFIQDENAESPLRVRVIDTLSTLELNSLQDQIKGTIQNKQLDPLVRGKLSHCLLRAKDSLSSLTELMQQKDLEEEVYLALYKASRYAGVMIFANPEGGYQIISPSSQGALAA